MAVKLLSTQTAALETAGSSMILSVSPDGILECLYWGSRIHRAEDFLGETSDCQTVNVDNLQKVREECSSYGSKHFRETSMKIRFADGTDDFRYTVQMMTVGTDPNELEVVLQDIHFPVTVHLYYRVYEEADVIEKWRKIENGGKDPVHLERFFSGEFTLPGEGYQSINYNGRWAKEFHMYSEPVDSGAKVYESFYGLTGHNTNPIFIIHQDAREDHGEVWYGALEWSGNFKTIVEPVNTGFLSVMTGISDSNAAVTLHEGESFTTPPVYAGYAQNGFGEMTRKMHRFADDILAPAEKRKEALPVLYNSWYATTFDVSAGAQIQLAEKAAELGVELFVVDDGWFVGRKDDTAGLGDWSVDLEKFPKGLRELTDRVHALGMKFGLWIEPEMVNCISSLYQKHPDWVYHYQSRRILEQRHQYELNMSDPEVVDYLTDTFDCLLSENDIDYIKWDMNRYQAERGTDTYCPEKWERFEIDNTYGIYRLIQRLREKHPEVEFEACASGGGRVDYGALRWFDEYWPSDNSDPIDRLAIQEAYSFLYPIRYMRAWYTQDEGMNHRLVPMDFSMHVAMTGALGIGIDLNRISEKEEKDLAGYIREYKQIRDTVQLGDLYRLSSFRNSPVQALEYVSRDRKDAVLFAFCLHERYGEELHTVRLSGLDPDKPYAFEIDGKRIAKTGEYLMKRGIDLRLRGDYASALVKIHADDH